MSLKLTSSAIYLVVVNHINHCSDILFKTAFTDVMSYAMIINLTGRLEPLSVDLPLSYVQPLPPTTEFSHLLQGEGDRA